MKTAALSDKIQPNRVEDRFYNIIQREQLPHDVDYTLHSALTGNLHYFGLLLEAMQDTWPRLQSNLDEVAEKVSNIEIKIDPFTEEDEEPTPQAKEKADFVRKALKGMRSDILKEEKALDGLVKALAKSYYTGHGVEEIIWELKNGEFLPKSTSTLSWRNFSYPYTYDQKDRLMLSPEGLENQLVDFQENKFIVGINKAHTGHASVASPLRCLTKYWISVTYGLKFFLQFAQLFGQPIRWGEYNDEAGRKTLEKLLKNFGASPWAAVPKGNSINIESSGMSAQGLPQAELINVADKTCDIYILGQSLTTDSGKNGSRALGEVHGDVRADRIQGVADYVAKILSDQLVKSIVELNYGNTDDLPTVNLEVDRPKDAKGMVERDKTLFSEMGLPVAKEWLYERHNVPVPEEGQEIFEPISSRPNGDQGEPGTGLFPHETKDVKASKAKKEVSNVDKIVDKITTDLAGVSSEWLSGVKPVFEKIVALAISNKVKDEDFLSAVEALQVDLPELFDDLNTKSLQTSLEEAMAEAFVKGKLDKLDELK